VGHHKIERKNDFIKILCLIPKIFSFILYLTNVHTKFHSPRTPGDKQLGWGNGGHMQMQLCKQV
jgi:hypothetical protein